MIGKIAFNSLHRRHILKGGLMLRTVIGFATFILIATSAFAGEGVSIEFFTMPSKNVFCLYSEGEDLISCDRSKPSYVSVTLTGAGKAFTTTDQSDNVSHDDANIIPYGKSWKKSGYKCLSAKTGITCTHGKHGFVMSKKSVKVY
jgi:hypothetical protein